MTEHLRRYLGASARTGPAVACLCLIAGVMLSGQVAGAAAPASREAASDWSRYIVGLLPAIEACTRDAPAKPVVVTGAYRIDGGRIGVRLRGPAEKRWTCTAPANGDAVSGYERLAPDERRPGEGDPLLTFGDPPGGECRSSEPVVAPMTGQLMGWLVYESC